MSARTESTASARDAGTEMLRAATALRPLIRDSVAEMDALRTLPPAVVEGLREAGVFRMTAPRDWGGPELDPVSQFRVIEELSAADASVGWCAYINSTSGFFTSFLDQDVARELYPDLDIPTGGMPTAIGRADRLDGGYRLTGHWSFGSGVKHCGWMVSGATVYADGEPVVRPDGSPETTVAFVSADQLTVTETWDAMGLRGTGSHDWAVDDVFIPLERTFHMFESPIRRDTPLFRFRNMYLFNHAPIAIGTARAAVEEFADVVRSKRTPFGPLRDQEYARTALAGAHALVDSARAYCVGTLEDLFGTVSEGLEPTLAQRARFRLAIIHAHRASVQAVDQVFEAAGTTAAVRLPSVLERCVRDVRVANQHMIANPHTYSVIGGMLLGEEPEDPTY